MTEKTVSIIVTVYNIEKYLPECVESIKRQTFGDIEILLVDDGATDGSGKLCDEYAATDDRIRVIHKKNGGLISAWSTGAKEALGHYLCFVDGDDWVDAEMIEELMKHARPEDGITEIISSNYIVEKKNEKRRERSALAPGVYEGRTLSEVRKKLLGEEQRPVIMSRCMKLITRQLVLGNLHYLNYDIRMAEDVNIMLPCLLDVDRLTLVEDGYFYHYRTLEQSMSHEYNNKLFDNIKLDYDVFLGIMKDKGVENGTEQMDREFVRLLFLVMKNELRCRQPKVVKRVRDRFAGGEAADIVRRTPVDVSGKAAKLIYAAMRNPTAPVILLACVVIRAFDKVTAGS